MKKAETLIVERIMRYLRRMWEFDGFHVHGNMMQRKGEPDLDGSILWGDEWFHLKIEVKTESGEPSQIQLIRLREYWRRGYLAGIVTSEDDIDRLVRAYGEYQHERSEGSQYHFKMYLERWQLKDRYGIYDTDIHNGR